MYEERIVPRRTGTVLVDPAHGSLGDETRRIELGGYCRAPGVERVRNDMGKRVRAPTVRFRVEPLALQPPDVVTADAIPVFQAEFHTLEAVVRQAHLVCGVPPTLDRFLPVPVTIARPASNVPRLWTLRLPATASGSRAWPRNLHPHQPLSGSIRPPRNPPHRSHPCSAQQSPSTRCLKVIDTARARRWSDHDDRSGRL